MCMGVFVVYDQTQNITISLFFSVLSYPKNRTNAHKYAVMENTHFMCMVLSSKHPFDSKAPTTHTNTKKQHLLPNKT